MIRSPSSTIAPHLVTFSLPSCMFSRSQVVLGNAIAGKVVLWEAGNTVSRARAFPSTTWEREMSQRSTSSFPRKRESRGRRREDLRINAPHRHSRESGNPEEDDAKTSGSTPHIVTFSPPSYMSSRSEVALVSRSQIVFITRSQVVLGNEIAGKVVLWEAGNTVSRARAFPSATWEREEKKASRQEREQLSPWESGPLLF